MFRPKNLWNWLVPSFSVLFCFCVGSRLMGKNGARSFLPFYFLVFFFPMGLWLQQCWCACFDQITRQTLNISREKPIRFSGILSISTPSPLPPPLTIAPFESVVVNRWQFQKASLLINHPHSNKRPFSNKHPCSVSVIALPECLYTEMHRGSSFFNCSLKASR